MENCKYAMPIKNDKTDKTYRVCTILGEKCANEAVYIDNVFVGNICYEYDKNTCKDKKVRE